MIAVYEFITSPDESASRHIALEEFVRGLDEKVVWYQDGTATEEVQGWAKLYQHLTYGRYHTLVVAELAQLNKTLPPLHEFLSWCVGNEIRVLSLRERLDTAAPEGAAVLTLVGLLAEADHKVRGQQVKEGIERARKRLGRDHFGSLPGQVIKMTPEMTTKVVTMYRNGMNVTDIHRHCNLSRTTIYKTLKEQGVVK